MYSDTPIDYLVPDEKLTEIEVQYDGTDEFQKMKAAKGPYHYNVYLPKGYSQSPEVQYPCIFIASPSGGASMGAMEGWIKSHRFIAIMLIESKNGPWGPILGNFLAAHDDAVKRFRILKDFKFATGFSGGARASSVFTAIHSGFGALILQGAGAWSYDSNGYLFLKKNSKIVTGALFGDGDGNLKERKTIESHIKKSDLKVKVFSGNHQWAPMNDIEEVLDWCWQESLKRQSLKDAIAFIEPFISEELKLIPAKENPIERYFAIESFLEKCKAMKIESIADDTKILSELEKECSLLKRDTNVALELRAEKSYQSCENSLEKFNAKKVDSITKAKYLQSLVKNYRSILKKYKGTLVEKKSQERIDELVKEAKELIESK